MGMPHATGRPHPTAFYTRSNVDASIVRKQQLCRRIRIQHDADIDCPAPFYQFLRCVCDPFTAGNTDGVDESYFSNLLCIRNFALTVIFMAAARGGKAKSDEPTFDTPADVDVIATFEGMGLKQNLLRGIFEFGFEKPTAIQQRAIVPMTSGRDVIAQAQSGTGKTAMLSISALQVVNVHSREVQVLCLNPTRELAVQVIRRYDFKAAFTSHSYHRRPKL